MKLLLSANILLVLVSTGYSQEFFDCPDNTGFYPHDVSCDKYWKCEEGVSTLLTCGNGLAFDDTDPEFQKENCDYLHVIDCGERQKIEPPISVPHCPRLYGIYPDDSQCTVFWNCWNGEANRYECAPGLGYDRNQRVCVWADQVPECSQEEIASGFECPPLSQDVSSGTFSKHPHPEDCRKYYVCQEGVAREYGCPIGTVFKIGDDELKGECTDPEFVEGCEDYYGTSDKKKLITSGL